MSRSGIVQIRDMLKTSDSESVASGHCVDAVLKVLDYTKTNKQWFDGHDLVAGYHSVTIQGRSFKGQRDPDRRLAKIDYDFSNKRVLDVGCSNGGLLHSLSHKIRFGVGLDFNAKCINAANVLKAVNGIGNIHFYTFDLDKEDLSMITHFVFGEKVDICFFFNISLWVKRWKDVFIRCADLTDVMVFEAHGSDQQQQGQLRFVQSVYQNARLISEQSDDDPTYAKRKMYLCENRVARLAANEAVEAVLFLAAHSEEAVKERYEKCFPGEQVESISFFPNTHESFVADINAEYIIKLPRPHRGLSGILAEQGITDLIRDKVALQMPAISIHTDGVVLARYRKLPGVTFDKIRYPALSEKDKQDLALEFSDFIYTLHSLKKNEIERSGVKLAPSWQISCDLIEEQLSDETDPAIKALLVEVVKNQRALVVPESNLVFGHFDLHGGNVLMNEQHNRVLGIIDFGNCKMGDVHQDLSVMNLSSSDLAERIASSYEKRSGRVLNKLLIQHYTTVFYLNLLAGLKRKNADALYEYWLKEFNNWYEYLLNTKAKQRLGLRKPVSALNHGWRKWLASNLMKGSSPNGLRKILREQGFPELDIAAELLLAGEHPYTEAGKEIFLTLNKRNWLLHTNDTLSALDKRYATQVEVRTTPGFDIFINEYYSKQLPVVLTGGVDHWPALKKWTPQYLIENFGSAEIEVQSDREVDPLYERNSGRHKKKLPMRTYAEMVLNAGESNDFYMTANNTKNSLANIERLFDDVADFGEGYRETNTIKSGNFFWFGPKGVFTPLHHDLTNNMLVQLYGRKRITLIPALQVPWLYNDKGVFSAADYPNFDEKRHPLVKNVTPVELILNPGEALFIPIGWWHCVEGLDISISISFTNFNAQNNFSGTFPR